MKKNLRKLQLCRETLLPLENPLRFVQGGGADGSDYILTVWPSGPYSDICPSNSGSIKTDCEI
jgi:hypothetical protein